MDHTALSLYYKELKKTPLLSREEETLLAKKAAAGDPGARARLIRANLRFVVMVAKRYRNRGLLLGDLINEGNIGLLKAVERYDPDRGFRFLSYAVWWIRQCILKALYEQAQMIRLPAHTITQLHEMERQRERYRKAYGSEPDLAETARLMHVDETYMDRLYNVSRQIASLQTLVKGDSGTLELGDLVEDRSAGRTEEATISASLKTELKKAMGRLSEREARILCDRFGVNGHARKTLAEIGDELHIARERVRQLEKRAISKLRHASDVKRLRAYLV
jgi:RNA polymerase primary sigma factor